MKGTIPGRYVVVPMIVVAGIVVAIAAAMLFGHPRGSVAPPPSVAVLPIAGDTTGAVTSEVIDALKPIPNFQVADAALYANKRNDTRALGEKLNVRTLLDGSVEGSRVTIRLINAADGFQLFSHTYERGPAFAGALAHDVADELVPK